jgi:predicted alpha/beta-fold hydrolase
MTAGDGAAQYQPAAWLRNAHLQSMLPSLPPRRYYTRYRSRGWRRAAQPWLLDCGDGVRLQAWHSRSAAPRGRTALLLHGWEGSADSCYVLSLGTQLLAAGYDLLRLNLRDHGGTHGLNAGLFHSCRLSDVSGALRAVAARLGAEPLYLAGFSLGGNFLLRAAAEPDLPSTVVGVVAISPVLDPSRALDAIEDGARVYHQYFVRKWSASLRIKQRLWPDEYDFTERMRSRNLRRMTDELVCAHTEFGDVDSYLDGYAITGARLLTLRVPARILAADDDPIIPSADLARIAPTAALQIARTPHGGHCGFLTTLFGQAWCDRFVLEQFEQFSAR